MLSYVLWPFVITAGTGATYLGLESGYPLPAVFFAVGAGMLACVLVAEQWIPRRPDWNALADRQSINDWDTRWSRTCSVSASASWSS